MDVTRRLAVQGYMTLTPDLFSRIGGKPPSGETDVERRQKIDLALPDDQVFDDLVNGYQYLKSRREVIQDRIALYRDLHGRGKRLLHGVSDQRFPLLRRFLWTRDRQGKK